MSKHTEGGWDWEYDKGNSDYVINAPLRMIAKLYATRDEVTDIANAKLIAAAPDLLKACEEMCEWLEFVFGSQFAGEPPHRKAREAIAKAKEACDNDSQRED